jgi:hypothetical protein
VLSDAERAHLERSLYPAALERAGELDSPRNRTIAANDYWLFLQAGGGSDADAIAALLRGLQSCERKAAAGPLGSAPP